MMQSGGTSPTLDDPPLPEFSGATLHLQQAVATNSAAKTSNAMLLTSNKANPNEEIFVDLVDLSLASGGGNSGAGRMEAVEAPTRKRRNTSPDSSESIFTASPLADGMARGYFSSRDSLLQRALHDCKRLLIHNDDGPLLGNWLLTQVDHWDNEKERLVLLFGRALVIVKYDFIALIAYPDYVRLPLNKITHLTIGRLGYPMHSITPKVQQVASRVSSILRGCLQQLGQEAGRGGGLLNISSTWRNGVVEQPDGLNTDTFHQNIDSTSSACGSVRREREGVRLMWKVSSEPKLAQLWNPWSKEIPWLVFVSHPLLSCRTDQHDPQFDVHDFISNIRDALQGASPTAESPPALTPQTPALHPPQAPVASTASLSQGSSSRPVNGTANECCFVEYSPILMESYIGLPALFHNYGQLGFYKVRGKFSF